MNSEAAAAPRVGSPASNERKRKAEDISGGAKQSTTKRLQGELRQLMVNGDSEATAFPKNDDLFDWVGTIKGSAGTVYEGLTFKISIKFPQDYPFSAPRIVFCTPCFHPNVDSHGMKPHQHLFTSVSFIMSMTFQCKTQSYSHSIFAGNICLDILKEKWSAAYTVRTILLSLRSLLGEPNNDSPLNGHAATLWQDQVEYKRVLLKKYAHAKESSPSS